MCRSRGNVQFEVHRIIAMIHLSARLVVGGIRGLNRLGDLGGGQRLRQGRLVEKHVAV